MSSCGFLCVNLVFSDPSKSVEGDVLPISEIFSFVFIPFPSEIPVTHILELFLMCFIKNGNLRDIGLNYGESS